MDITSYDTGSTADPAVSPAPPDRATEPAPNPPPRPEPGKTTGGRDADSVATTEGSTSHVVAGCSYARRHGWHSGNTPPSTNEVDQLNRRRRMPGRVEGKTAFLAGTAQGREHGHREQMNGQPENMLKGAVAGAAGTTVLNAVGYGDMAVRGRPASSTPGVSGGSAGRKSAGTLTTDRLHGAQRSWHTRPCPLSPGLARRRSARERSEAGVAPCPDSRRAVTAGLPPAAITASQQRQESLPGIAS